MVILAGVLLASCEDFLNTSSPSVVDRDFVFSNPITSRAALVGAYEQWRSTAQNTFFGDGLFYAWGWGNKGFSSFEGDFRDK